jgi:hypothetical protein
MATKGIPIFLINILNCSLESEDPFEEFRKPRVGDREDDYTSHKRNRLYSPPRIDPMLSLSKKGKEVVEEEDKTEDRRSYYDIMAEVSIENERSDVLNKIKQSKEEMKTVHTQPASRKKKKLDDGSSVSVSVERNPAAPSRPLQTQKDKSIASTTLSNTGTVLLEEGKGDWEKAESANVPVTYSVSDNTPRRAVLDTPSRRNRWDLMQSKETGATPGRIITGN